MDTQEALLATIAKYPKEDLPRLAYADWLEENPACWQCRGTGGRNWHDDTMGAISGPCGTCDGNGLLTRIHAAQAKYIRVGCALRMPLIHAPLCDTPWNCDHDPDYNPGREAGGPQWVWNRGFLVAIYWNAAAWRIHGKNTIRRHPTIQKVELCNYRPYCVSPTIWGWYDATRMRGRAELHEIPGDLFCHLPLAKRVTVADGRADYWAWYKTELDAKEAISIAAIAWAKNEKEGGI